MIHTHIRAGLVFLLFFLYLPALAGGDVITLRADEWCPYNCDPHSDAPGFIVEMAQVIFKKAGHSVDYDIMPWARAIQDTRKGKFNGIIGAGKEDAPDFIFPETEQAQMVNVFYVRKNDSWKYDGVGSLEGKVLGVIKDYTYIDDIDTYISEHEKNSKKVQVASGESALDSNVKKLLAGRIDILIEDSNVMGLYIKKNLKENQLQTAGNLPPDMLFIAFSPANPKSPSYAEIISKGIVELRQSGELNMILDKYGLKDWK